MKNEFNIENLDKKQSIKDFQKFQPQAIYMQVKGKKILSEIIDQIKEEYCDSCIFSGALIEQENGKILFLSEEAIFNHLLNGGSRNIQLEQLSRPMNTYQDNASVYETIKKEKAIHGRSGPFFVESPNQPKNELMIALACISVISVFGGLDVGIPCG